MSHENIPLFPLGTVLFPDTLLPLQIFEVRYLDLVRKCLRDQTGFGVVTLQSGGEVRRPDERIELARFGTLVSIEHAEATDSTLMKIQVKGIQRFELLSFEQQKNGLWTGQIRPIPADPVIQVPEDLAIVSDTLAKLLESLQARTMETAPVPFSKPYRLMDCGWVANRWCEMLPLSNDIKIQLLALDNPLLRLELVLDQLQEFGLIKP